MPWQHIAVVSCTKFCSDHCVGIEARVKQNFHRIWMAIENPLVKCAAVLISSHRPISAYSMTTKEKEHVIAKALYQMSPNSSDLIQRAMGQPVTSKDPIELAKGDASQAIKDFISDLDRTGVLKGKQYNDIVSSVLAQEQEVMQRAGDRRHSEGDHLGSHTGRTKDNHNPTLLVRPPSGRPLSGRPLSGKSVSSRPQSGKSVGSRPQSGRLDGTTSQSVPSYMIGNSPPQQDGKSPANRPQSAKSLCNLFNKTSPGMDHHQFTDATSCKPAGSRPQSAKSQASSTGSRPASGKKPPSVIIRPPSGRKTSLITSSGKTSGDSVVKSDATVNYGRPLSGKSSVSTEGSTNPSTFSQQPGVVRQLTRSQSAPMARRGSSARPGSAKLSTTNAGESLYPWLGARLVSPVHKQWRYYNLELSHRFFISFFFSLSYP